MSDKKRKLVAIVFTDIAGFSELSASDENRAMELVNIQRELIQPIIDSYDGTLHKEIGDGFLLTFPTVTASVEFGIDFQRAIKHHDELKVRIGIHEGEVTVQENDVFGDDVNVGARIEPYSPVGGIAISEKVKLEIGSLPEYQTEYIGEPELKGISQPIKIYCISSHGLPSPKKSVRKGSVSEERKGFNFNILSITGILLTVVGFAFWAWYGFGSISQGREIDNKIFKSIAVLYLENLSNDSEGENWCAGITDGIITSISKLGIFDVRSRTDVVQFRNKLTTHDQIGEILGVDTYITGSLQKIGEKVFANISLIDTRNGVNIWAERFEKTTSDIFNIPEIISKEISHALGADISPEIFSTSAFKGSDDTETLSLLGKGINLLDSGKYDKSIKIFDSLLVSEPDNKHAIYSKGQALENKGNYAAAIKSYELISADSTSLSRLGRVWKHPDIEEIDNIDFYEKVLISEQLNIQIILSRNFNTNSTEIFSLDLTTNKELWAKTYRFTGIKPKIVGDNLVLASSTSGKMEATVYVHSLKTGRMIFSKEFSKRHKSERVLISVMKGEDLNDTKYNDRVFLNIRRDDTYNVIMLDLNENIVQWEKSFLLETVSEGDPLIYLIEEKNKLYALHKKGVNYYFFRVSDGTQIWEGSLSDKDENLFVHNNKFYIYSKNHSSIKLKDLFSQNIIGDFEADAPVLSVFSFKENVIFQTKHSISSLKTYKPFLRSILNWTVEINKDDLIRYTLGINNNIFALTRSGDLYCINASNGHIIHINNLDSYDDYKFRTDWSSKVFVLYTDGFLTGLDPHNGKILWKIREVNLTNPANNIQFTDNKLIVFKRMEKDETLLIKTYNRNTGALLWIADEHLDTGKPRKEYRHQVYSHKNQSIYIGVNDGAIYSLDLSWNPDKNYISKTDLFNRLAFCHIKLNQYAESENILKQIVGVLDQQNERAYLQLSELYLSQDNINEYIQAQAEYYELVQYDDLKRGKIESDLMRYGNLQWVNNFRNEYTFAVNLQDNNLTAIGRCERDYGCTISAFRKQSGVKLWEKFYPEFERVIYKSEINAEFVIVGVDTESEVHIYKLFFLDTTSGSIKAEYPLMEEPEGENYLIWALYHFDNLYLIDSVIEDVRSLTAIDDETYAEIWVKEYEENRLLRGKPIDIIQYKNNIIIPLSEELQSVNLSSGAVEWTYDFTDDFEGIEYLNQHGLNKNRLALLSEDDEFIVINLYNQEVVVNEDVNFDEPVIIKYLDGQQILGYNNSGYIVRFDIGEEGAGKAWSLNLNNIETITLLDGNIYVFNSGDFSIGKFNRLNGKKIDEIQLIWQPEDVFYNNKTFNCFTGRKLYFINL